MKFHEISRAEISEADFNPAIAVGGVPCGGPHVDRDGRENVHD